MAVIERLGTDKLGPEKPGPEKYAPPARRAPETLSDADHIAFLRQQRSQAASANGPAAEDLNAVVRRVAGDSMEEIDRVIRALENVRDMMRNEGERVSREIAGYASLSHAAATAMKVIADSIKEWKDGPDKSAPPSVS
jgi:hypothetical protein